MAPTVPGPRNATSHAAGHGRAVGGRGGAGTVTWVSTHEIRIQLPLPAHVLGALLELLGDRWPSSRIATSDDRHMVVHLDDSDVDDPDAGSGEDGGSGAGPDVEIDVTRAGAEGISMSPPPEVVGLLVESFREILDAHAAPNYVEMTVVDPDSGGTYTVTIGRPGGATPHQLRVAAEERAEAAIELLKMWRRGNRIYLRSHPRSWVSVDDAASPDTAEALDPALVALLEEIYPDA